MLSKAMVRSLGLQLMRSGERVGYLESLRKRKGVGNGRDPDSIDQAFLILVDLDIITMEQQEYLEKQWNDGLNKGRNAKEHSNEDNQDESWETHGR